MGRTRPVALFATLGSLTLVTGCASWQKVRIGEGGTPILSNKEPVRVLLKSGNTIWLANPQVVSDSLIGEVGNPAHRLAVSLNEVKKLEEQKKSTGKGIGIGCGVLLAITAVGALLTIIGAMLDQM